MDAALDVRGLTHVERLVLICLAQRAGHDRIAWVGQSWIADKIEAGERSVRMAIRTLCTRGIIRACGRRGRVRAYELMLVDRRDAAQKPAMVAGEQPITGNGCRSKPAMVAGEQPITGNGCRSKPAMVAGEIDPEKGSNTDREYNNNSPRARTCEAGGKIVIDGREYVVDPLYRQIWIDEDDPLMAALEETRLRREGRGIPRTEHRITRRRGWPFHGHELLELLERGDRHARQRQRGDTDHGESERDRGADRAGAGPRDRRVAGAAGAGRTRGRGGGAS